MRDLRETYFGSAPWYRDLGEPTSGEPSAWHLAKAPPSRTHVALANMGLEFAEEHGLRHSYSAKFAGIPRAELTPERATTQARSVTFPISEILNELIVGALLKRGLGWTFAGHEPPGHRSNRGDWEFTLECGRRVFVEVKSLSEPQHGSGPFWRSSAAPRLSNVLKRSYRQLPLDDRATVVVLVADGGALLDIPNGIEHGDLFQAFFGQTVIQFDFDGMQLHSPRLTSTFREMYVQRNRNRRLGAVFGLEFRGIGLPVPNLYALHNPFAHSCSSLPLVATVDLARFYVAVDGEPHFDRGVGGEALWQRCASYSPAAA